MKKIRRSAVFLMLACILVYGLTGCYGKDNNVESVPVTESAVPNGTAENNGNGVNANGSTASESSTGGVINGLMEDMSNGINDMTGATLPEDTQSGMRESNTAADD